VDESRAEATATIALLPSGGGSGAAAAAAATATIVFCLRFRMYNNLENEKIEKNRINIEVTECVCLIILNS
jgi:hypothetical protein